MKKSESKCVFRWLRDPAEFSLFAQDFHSEIRVAEYYQGAAFLLHCSFFFLFFIFFFFKHAFVAAEKVKRFFFQPKLSGLSENRTFHKANFPWCSGNIITPKHHSFSMTSGFIYKKKTSLTPINTKYSHRLYVSLSSMYWNWHTSWKTNLTPVNVMLESR